MQPLVLKHIVGTGVMPLAFDLNLYFPITHMPIGLASAAGNLFPTQDSSVIVIPQLCKRYPEARLIEAIAVRVRRGVVPIPRRHPKPCKSHCATLLTGVLAISPRDGQT